MLTGVLANFFGYLLKGAAHMKAFFKGGEGWKYLTPEMLAAEKAGKLVEQSFYSDAKAAAVLQQALRNLLDEFAMLEAKAKSGAISPHCLNIFIMIDLYNSWSLNRRICKSEKCTNFFIIIQKF